MLIPFLHRLVRRNLLSHGISSQRIRIGGTLFHYYEAKPENPRETVVLVHGLGTSTSTWAHVLPALAKEYHVFAPDLPGFGFSLEEDGFLVHSIDQYVDGLRRLFRHTLPESFVLLGHSLGGWLTMKYALLEPGRIKHLVLVNPAGVYYQGAEQLAGLFDVRSARDTRILLDRIWKKYPWYFRPFTPFVFEDLVRRRVPEIVKAIEERDFINADLHRFRMPVSIVWGTGDSLLSFETVRILEERLPARTVHLIKESGHVPQLEAPFEFLRTLREILRDRVF